MQPDKAVSDRELWRLITQENDTPAFELLYRRYMQVLMAAIYKWSEDRAEAEDILQETFLDLWEKRKQIHIKQDIFPYLYSITRYKIFDRLREKKLTNRQLHAWHSVSGEATVPSTAFREEDLASKEILVSSELAQLPAQMKRVYLLSAEQGMSIREISEELLVSPYTVKNHLQKIRKRLRNAAVRLSSFFW
ncbi:MAG TPA: sigma-70 family RNA polymerase sigma factor [Puia sp.]|nr:sigma-70 family RNA polymerase sigma factor [Puia sp.]